MAEIQVQADALRTRLLSHPDEIALLGDPLLACAGTLVETGDPLTAIELIRSAGTAFKERLRWKIELGVVEARALLVAGSVEESLHLSKALLDEFRSNNEYEESIRSLEIIEAASLRQMNRCEEAISKLILVRTTLIGRRDSFNLAWCSHALALAELYVGDLDSARRDALDALVSARRSGARYFEAYSHWLLSWLDRTQCHWMEARENARLATEVSLSGGFGVLIAAGLRSSAVALWKQGRLDKASAAVEEHIARISQLRNKPLLRYGHLLRGLICLHRGDVTNARAMFSDAGASDSSTRIRASILSDEFKGDIEAECGDYGGALLAYNEAFNGCMATMPRGDIVAELRRRRAECYYQLNRHAEAYEEAKIGLEHCRELGDRYEEAATYRILALCAAAIGKPAEAKRWFDQGFAYYDDIETPYEWGRLWMAYGDWQSGPHAAEYADIRHAREAYLAAVDHFEGMGAEGKLKEARERVARLDAAHPSADATMGLQRNRPRRRPRLTADDERRARLSREQFGLITVSKVMLNVLEEAAKYARGRLPVLILGESGTGKEHIASGIHRLSGRSGNYMPVNCAALPKDVIESELFGHSAGAFTGAIKDKAGLLEVCDGGTVFLDEIGDLSPELQSRLLRFLESGELRRVGSTRNVRVDTRVVAATNRERVALERGENFRIDLYYRLAHAVVGLAPLRRRPEDIEVLAEHFVAESSREQGKQVTLSDGALDRMREYGWPGNVRELRSTIERMVLLAADRHAIGADEVSIGGGSAPAGLAEELEEAEKQKLAEALRVARGSRTEAAKALGIPRTTLINKMRRLGIEA